MLRSQLLALVFLLLFLLLLLDKLVFHIHAITVISCLPISIGASLERSRQRIHTARNGIPGTSIFLLLISASVIFDDRIFSGGLDAVAISYCRLGVGFPFSIFFRYMNVVSIFFLYSGYFNVSSAIHVSCSHV